MAKSTGTVDAWDVEGHGRDWVGRLARTLLALYLVPALLAALAVGGLALALGAVGRLLRAAVGGPLSPSHARSAAPVGHRSGQGWHLDGHSRSAALGRPGPEVQPWP